MFNFAALLHGPAYLLYGVPALLTLSDSDEPVPLRVVDKTSGVEVPGAGDHDASVSTVLPAALVRMGELQAAGLSRARLSKARLAFNGKTYRIDTTVPRPTAAGEADGELLLLLSETRNVG